MQHIPVITKDGSPTISIPEMKVTYHSMHGALQESQHVYVDAGFKHVSQRLAKPGALSVLEVGFGTGLNALLTMMETAKTDHTVYYVALEPFPLTLEEVRLLNYCELLGRKDLLKDYLSMHECEWNNSVVVSEHLLLHKSKNTLEAFEHTTGFHLVYFDAFAPKVQPELWTKETFEKLFAMMLPGAVLVTYCSKGDVRRAMQAAGFYVEKLPGPPGKREMLRAIKNH